MSDTNYCSYLDNKNQDLENPEGKAGFRKSLAQKQDQNQDQDLENPERKDHDQDYYYDNDNDDYDDDDDDDDTTYKFTDYEELLVLTKQEETKYKINNIIFALMKVIIIKKYNEVSFKFDFKLGPYKNWIDIAEYFNSNYVGTDYRILIDEDAIVCKLLNEDLIAY